jgi:hypothetical protein
VPFISNQSRIIPHPGIYYVISVSSAFIYSYLFVLFGAEVTPDNSRLLISQPVFNRFVRIHLILLAIGTRVGSSGTNYSATCFLNTFDVNLPVRYAFLQILDEQGQNVTNSIGQLETEVTLPGDSCRMRKMVVDRFDGTYIVRIRLWSHCKRLKLTIRAANEGISQSSLCEIIVASS